MSIIIKFIDRANITSRQRVPKAHQEHQARQIDEIEAIATEAKIYLPEDGFFNEHKDDRFLVSQSVAVELRKNGGDYIGLFSQPILEHRLPLTFEIDLPQLFKEQYFRLVVKDKDGQEIGRTETPMQEFQPYLEKHWQAKIKQMGLKNATPALTKIFDKDRSEEHAFGTKFIWQALLVNCGLIISDSLTKPIFACIADNLNTRGNPSLEIIQAANRHLSP